MAKTNILCQKTKCIKQFENSRHVLVVSLRSIILSFCYVIVTRYLLRIGTMKAKRTRNVLTTSQSQEPSEADLPDKQKARLTAILGSLQQAGSVAVDELSTRLGVSLVTVRRDLDILE